ncbi:MAG: aspartate aminotransferase family protein [Pseudomonadota bacterium]
MTRHDLRLAELRDRYAAAHPRSAELVREAAAALPGGNTRSVLHFEPFPIVMESGREDRLTCVDGHQYLDCAGEFSAGLYGHSESRILEAVREALSRGLVLGAPTQAEGRLAALIAGRFASVEKLRFCNSGTEANLMALATARAVTGRERIVVFRGAYHGGVLTFPEEGANPLNVPFPVTALPFNDAQAVRETLAREGAEIAAVIVEPILGAAGNMPAEPEFLAALREATREAGALLIFDEVKTSRLGAGGMQGLTGVVPDMTTLGKYLGGGLHFGAFGGPAEIMDRFDPARPDALKHAGTFNNSPLSLAAGIAGLSEVFTPERAEAFLALCEGFRHDLSRRLEARGLPVRVTGLGSILSLHMGERAPRNAAEVDPRTARMRRILHLLCLESGVALTPRGDVFLSLPMGAETLESLAATLAEAAAEAAGFAR